jgi:two-component system, sensor histidine kinase and response regulator
MPHPVAFSDPKNRSLNGFPEDQSPSSTGRVLVVDDEACNRILLTDWLGPYGHQVTTAANGLDALRAVELELPDAILLDVKMPGMDGFAVCTQLKSNPRTAMIPILLLTSLQEREDRLRGMRAGANDFLFKPVDLPDLLLRVRNAVRLRHLHEEVEAKLREVCRQEQLKESLLHMIVHDLRTPLAALDGFLQLMLCKPVVNAEDRHPYFLQQALRASQKLAQQIDLLLDIHRLEEGQMPVQAVSHDLSQVVDDAVTPLRSLFGDRRLEMACPPQPLTAVGDPGLLGRVVANLVGNAIAFTSPENGEIFVRVLPRPGRARVEVADNGPGIATASQQAIFEKFYQVNTHDPGRSSGLGLTFCKLALEAQHGSIGVVSEVGAGAQFWFEVPALVA